MNRLTLISMVLFPSMLAIVTWRLLTLLKTSPWWNGIGLNHIRLKTVWRTAETMFLAGRSPLHQFIVVRTIQHLRLWLPENNRLHGWDRREPLWRLACGSALHVRLKRPDIRAGLSQWCQCHKHGIFAHFREDVKTYEWNNIMSKFLGLLLPFCDFNRRLWFNNIARFPLDISKSSHMHLDYHCSP